MRQMSLAKVIILDPEHDCFINPFCSAVAEDFFLVNFLICGDQAIFMADCLFLVRIDTIVFL